MDKVYHYNKERWEALVKAKALFTRPWLDLDAGSARERLDRWGLLGDIAGKQVLCLAGGGGQQSVAFALLGADVSVLDLSDGQLAQDREAAAHYGLEVSTHQGDMRDLSRFEDGAFDIVWHPYALNFVPDCRVVFREVARVLRPGGLYHFGAANPFAAKSAAARTGTSSVLTRVPPPLLLSCACGASRACRGSGEGARAFCPAHRPRPGASPRAAALPRLEGGPRSGASAAFGPAGAKASSRAPPRSRASPAPPSRPRWPPGASPATATTPR